MDGIVRLEPQAVTVDMVMWHKFAIEAEAIANSIVITDDEEEAMAIDSRTKIKEFGKQVEDARTVHVRPFNDFVTRINGMFKPLTGAIDGASGEIGRKLLEYKHKKDEERRNEEVRRQEEYRKKLAEEQERVDAENKKRIEEASKLKVVPQLEEVKVELPAVILPTANTTMGNYGKATTVKRWVAEVRDRKAFLLWLTTVDESNPMHGAIEIKVGVLNKEAVRLKGRSLYPGVEFKQEESIR